MTRVFPSDTMDTRAALPVARPQCATPGCKGRPAYTDADGFRVCGACFRSDRGERDPDGALRDEPTPVESAMPSKPRLITCIDCGKEKPLKAAGRCAACYGRDLKARQSASVESGIMPGPSAPPPSPVEAPVPPREEVPVVETPWRQGEGPTRTATTRATSTFDDPPTLTDELLDRGCTCCISPPCSFCLALDEEQADAYASDGVSGVRALIARREEQEADRDLPTIEEADAILRAAGADPEAIRAEGEAFARGLLDEKRSATATAALDKDCDDAPGSGYATEARLRAERDRYQAEVVTLRGHVEHDYRLVADRPLGERNLYRCARPGCGDESEAPVRAYFDGGCVVARVPDPRGVREARIAELEASRGRWQRTVLAVMGVCDAYRLDGEIPVVRRVEHLLDRARAADGAEARIAELETRDRLRIGEIGIASDRADAAERREQAAIRRALAAEDRLAESEARLAAARAECAKYGPAGSPPEGDPVDGIRELGAQLVAITHVLDAASVPDGVDDTTEQATVEQRVIWLCEQRDIASDASAGAIAAIVRMGHHDHCAKRLAWGDGVCECAVFLATRDTLSLRELLCTDSTLEAALWSLARVLDDAGVPGPECNRGPTCRSLHLNDRIHRLADERDALRRRTERAEAELRTIREALGRHPAVDAKEVIADIGRLTSEAGGYGRATLAHRALRNDIAHALGYTDGAGSTPDGDLVDELGRRLAQEPAQETITVRVTCPLGDRDESLVPSDVRRERVVFGALVEIIEEDFLELTETEQLGPRRAAVLRALRALGGLEGPNAL